MSEDWKARAERAEAALKRVEDLHSPEEPPEGQQWVSGGRKPMCKGCGLDDPFEATYWVDCPTRAAIEED